MARSFLASSGERFFVTLSISLRGPLVIESSVTSNRFSSCEKSKCGIITPIDPVIVEGSAKIVSS